ncbi:MAG: LPS export ABC transporter periplasmic protein LptC, partial [Acidobacteriota bacterium]
MKRFEFRASLPKYFRLAAVGALVLTVLMVVIGFYRSRNNPEFRMKGFPTTLSKDVIAEINGYERRETEGNVVKYYIKADKAITFTDNHQELENVYLQVFGPEGNYDQITAAKAVYVPEEEKNFTAYFAGNVQIDTRDRLKVKTEQITYKKADETAAADEQIAFERESVKGRATTALVHIPQKLVELFKNVEIETFQ